MKKLLSYCFFFIFLVEALAFTSLGWRLIYYYNYAYKAVTFLTTYFKLFLLTSKAICLYNNIILIPDYVRFEFYVGFY